MARANGKLLRLAPLGLAIFVFLAAAACMSLTRWSGNVAAVWPVNAIVVAALLTWRRQPFALLAAAFIGNLAANFAFGDPWAQSLLLAVANAAESFIIFHMLAAAGRLRFERQSGLLRLVFAAACGSLASAVVATTGQRALGIPATLGSAALWCAADFLSIVIFAPVALALIRNRLTLKIPAPDWQTVSVFAALIAITIGVFTQSTYSLLFVPTSLMTLVAIRSGFRGAILGVLIVGVIATTATVLGHGPITLLSMGAGHQAVLLQVFLATLTLISLLVGAVSAERRAMIVRLTRQRRERIAKTTREQQLVSQAELAAEISEVGYWTLDAQAGTIFWSPEVYRIHGVSPETYTPSLDTALSFFPEEDRERVVGLIRAASDAGTGWAFDATIIRADGERREVRSLARCKLTAEGEAAGLFGVFKDLTEERALAAKVIEQEKRYRLLADNATDVIAVYGADGAFTYLSPSVSELLGYTAAEMIGRKPVEFMHEDDWAPTLAAFQAGVGGEAPFSVEYRMIAKDGSVRWLEARPRVQRDAAGDVVEIIDSVRDVTLRRQREAEAAEARAMAEEAASAKAAFLATMSHEIRTPLNGVIGFADVLARTPLNDEQARYVERIRAAGRGLGVLINDILDYSKIEAGKLEICPEPMDLHALTLEIMDLVRVASGKALHFAVHYSKGVSPWVVGDDQRIRQVLLNLIGNAAKFTETGSVELFVSEVGANLEFRVIDTGVGIKPEVLETLFSGFTQGDSSVSRKYGGTGLGLVISRSLARLMNGDVWLTSRPGRGTTANFVMAYTPAAAPDADEAAASRPARAMTVLAVDDIEANLELLSILLEGAGHHVSLARSGAEALETLAANPAFDVVLMDVQMPEMDGLETTRRLRAMDGPAARVPVVALTANVMADQIAACREAGMDDHLGKPVKEADLLRTLARFDAAPVAAALAAPAAAPDPLAGLKNRYRAEMPGLREEFARLAALPAGEGHFGLKAKAHAVAGTAGSLGFTEVSQAAFALEDAAGGDGSPVEPAVAALLAALDAVVMEAAA